MRVMRPHNRVVTTCGEKNGACKEFCGVEGDSPIFAASCHKNRNSPRKTSFFCGVETWPEAEPFGESMWVSAR
jgi:hypothetical protein